MQAVVSSRFGKNLSKHLNAKILLLITLGSSRLGARVPNVIMVEVRSCHL